MSGKLHLELQYTKGEKQCRQTEAGNSGLYYISSSRKLATKTKVISGDNLKGIIINVDSRAMSLMAQGHLPLLTSRLTHIAQLGLRPTQAQPSPYSPISPALRMAIQQIFAPPLSGGISCLYLESKILELLALKLADIANGPENQSQQYLKPDDIRCIHRAREIMLANLVNPPTIPDLARMAGTNDQKLKYGFRQVFGNTVYRTLKTARMEEARKYFDRAEESVLQVANRVGYTNPGHFAAAFRAHFGVTPSAYLAHRRLKANPRD